MDHLNNLISAQYKNSEEFKNNLYERFLHLAQNILCDRRASQQVSHDAIESLQNQFAELPPDGNIFQHVQSVLDCEIDNFFKKLIQNIECDPGSEKLLFTILNKRFKMITCKKIAFDQVLKLEDADDIVQNALFTVFKKCKTAKPKETFLQWAQTILNYKYKECRRKANKQAARIDSISDIKSDAIYAKLLSHYVKKARAVKEADIKETKLLQHKPDHQPEQDPFENDPFSWSPILFTEASDLKTNLLTIVRKMGNRCKKVLKILFDGGDRRTIQERHPDLGSIANIDVILTRCRKKLKEQALKERVL